MPGKLKSIMYSAPMVRSMLAGDKTETRRQFADQPPPESGINYTIGNQSWLPKEKRDPLRHVFEAWGGDLYNNRPEGHMCGLAYSTARFVPGDRVYVKEDYRTFVSLDNLKSSEIWSPDQERGAGIAYEAGGGLTITRGLGDRQFSFDEETRDMAPFGKIRLAMFMPAHFSRLTLTITDVEAQRLHDMTDDDAIAEGVIWSKRWKGFVVPGVEHPNKDFPVLSRPTPREMYAALFDTINGSGAWGKNPWVWRYRFTVARRNKDGTQ